MYGFQDSHLKLLFFSLLNLCTVAPIDYEYKVTAGANNTSISVKLVNEGIMRL